MKLNISSSRIVLGTAQFGFKYGVANTVGRVSATEAGEILRIGREHGIKNLDTAIAYGESEAILGQIGVNGWGVITKFPALPPSCSDVYSWLARDIKGALDRLHLRRIKGVLLHRPAQLLTSIGPDIYHALCRLKDNNLIEQFGISVYNPEELDRHPAWMRLDLVQAPFNIMDRRIVASGWARKLQETGVELHVRSVFLQGLLLLHPEERPQYFEKWKPLWLQWDKWLAHTGLTTVEACIRFALSFQEVDKLVLGVDSAAQLHEILRAVDGNMPGVPSQLQTDDPDLLNPSYWNLA